MVSPGELRLVAELTEGEGEFTPDIEDDGTVSYSAADRVLDEDDDDAIDVLERFAARGVLANEFVSKVYICPECDTEGMQYTTACPNCESAHAIETMVFEHAACGYVGPREDFEAGGEYACPDCGMAVQPEDLDGEQRYACRDCGEIFENPDDRLWCRNCLYMFPPGETIERALYRYGLSEDGADWLERHRAAREGITETLEERRFDTRVDATVTDDSGTDRSVHVLAEDDLLGERRVVAIEATPDIERVEAFCDLADAVDAHPIVITTAGTVGEEVARLARANEITLLAARPDGTLGSDYEVTEGAPERGGFFERLTTAVDVPAWRGQ